MGFAKRSLRRRMAQSFVIGAEQLEVEELSAAVKAEGEEHARQSVDAGSQPGAAALAHGARPPAVTHARRVVALASVVALGPGAWWLLGAAVLSSNDTRPDPAVVKAQPPLVFHDRRLPGRGTSGGRPDPSRSPAQTRLGKQGGPPRSSPTSLGRKLKGQTKRGRGRHSPSPPPPVVSAPPPTAPVVPGPVPVDAPSASDVLPAPVSNEAQPATALEPPGVREFGP